MKTLFILSVVVVLVGCGVSDPNQVRELPASELAGITGKAEASPVYGFDVEIYNGTSWKIESVDIEIKLNAMNTRRRFRLIQPADAKGSNSAVKFIAPYSSVKMEGKVGDYFDSLPIKTNWVNKDIRSFSYYPDAWSWNVVGAIGKR